MSLELNLTFPDKDHVIVSFDGEPTGALPFTNPLTAKDRRDIRWYLETYATLWGSDPDDSEARRIADQLAVWGKALFNAVFQAGAARRLFNRFQDNEDEARLLTISAEHPAILSLPWELLHDPAKSGVHLFLENPRISIRRRMPGATDGRRSFRVQAKDRLHLLFVVSRPEGAGFLDPRADAGAVLDALEHHAPGCFTWEFLPSATIDALVKRLEDKDKTPVDILHFDGHGVFDRDGGLPERVEEQKGLLMQLLAGELVRTKVVEAPAKSPPNIGYLIFERPDGDPDFIPAQRLGENLHRHKVALVILSACQTAMLGDNDEPMGSVAVRLTAAGIPAVLAMTHSVLVPTTRALFGELYEHLAEGCGIGESLDNARRYLKNHPEKYEVQRGPDRVWLKLDDWFLPALYQSGADVPLLKKAAGAAQQAPAPQPHTNLPPCPESGFFGRRRELWNIERWYADKARRITITGFGGQGKTALAQEAGRWLTRTGMFRAAVFVGYAHVQGRDAVAVAVNEIGSVLGQSLIDAGAAEDALVRTPTLVILDNLEALAPESLHELLDAAVGWSQAGGSRVLCTTRKPEFGHQDYRVEGTNIHRRIVLEGLGSRDAPDDALEWCAELMALPPAPTLAPPSRQELVDLFDKVRFHPLSIRVLAQQLKTRHPAELDRRLEELLATPPPGGPGPGAAAPDGDTPDYLVASLQLSLDKLDDAARRVLPRLGVFQGGAIEERLLAITEIGEEVWPTLRQQLEAAALIEAETLPGVGVPFLRFHPTLAPMLWAQLGAEDRARLGAAHRRRYYALANYLYQSDDKSPLEARAIARRELPNLLQAVHAALDAGDPEAVVFAESVNKLLVYFGLKQESAALVAQAQAVAGVPGSLSWYLAQSNRGEQLLNGGRAAEATQIFRNVLKALGDAPSYQRAMTLAALGQCLRASGRPDLAAQHQREALAVFERLEQTHYFKRERAACLGELADALADQGQHAQARVAYEHALTVFKEVRDARSQGVVLGNLGVLAMREGNLKEAADRYRAALALFQQLKEPEEEAVWWHQLGRVFQEAHQWDEAERHYREAARLKELQGSVSGPNGAVVAWNQLGQVSRYAGKPGPAEAWYRKAIEAGRRASDQVNLAKCLNNLAGLLGDQPGRLAEARELAEEALAIKDMLDPGALAIWTTYTILAGIVDKEAQATSANLKAELQVQAREYRRLARDARRNFPGMRNELRRHAQLIVATVAACARHKEARELVAKQQAAMRQGGEDWANLAAALDRLLAGERDADTLCEDLGPDQAMIIEAILQGIADPSSLQDLLPDQKP